MGRAGRARSARDQRARVRARVQLARELTLVPALVICVRRKEEVGPVITLAVYVAIVINDVGLREGRTSEAV